MKKAFLLIIVISLVFVQSLYASNEIDSNMGINLSRLVPVIIDLDNESEVFELKEIIHNDEPTIGKNKLIITMKDFLQIRESLEVDMIINNENSNVKIIQSDEKDIQKAASGNYEFVQRIQGNITEWNDGDFQSGEQPTDKSPFYTWGALGLNKKLGGALWVAYDIDPTTSGVKIVFYCYSTPRTFMKEQVDVSLRYFDTWDWYPVGTIVGKGYLECEITIPESEVSKFVYYDGKCHLILESKTGFVIDYVDFYQIPPPKLDVEYQNIPNLVSYRGERYLGKVRNIGDGQLAWNSNIVGGSSWISISPKKGNLAGGDYTSFTITVNENISYSSRQDKIKIYNENKSAEYKIITINQEGKPRPPELVVRNLNISKPVSYKGDSFNGRVYNDGGGTLNWNTSISDPNWIHVNPPSGSTTNYQSITVIIDKNDGGEREGSMGV